MSLKLPSWLPIKLWRSSWTVGCYFAIFILIVPEGTIVERLFVLLLIPCCPFFFDHLSLVEAQDSNVDDFFSWKVNVSTTETTAFDRVEIGATRTVG